ncbi:MAG: putative DNA-binding domain-containing protein [Pseudomonadales bacterium]
MPRRGDNLPGFVEHQLDFAAHIRNPAVHPRPADVEARRMQIYLDLFYNNIESFLAGAFPVAKSLLAGERWPALVRAFVHRHPSESPYFLEISQEFLSFLATVPDLSLGDGRPNDLPPFLLELCHYEWVELALSVAEEEIPEDGIYRDGDLLAEVVVVSPLIWKLAYAFPVHQIGPDHQPEAPGDSPTQLVVFRRRDDRVRFMEVNALTMALLDALEGDVSGAEALDRVAGQATALHPETVHREGLATLERLRNAEVVLGTRRQSGDASP